MTQVNGETKFAPNFDPLAGVTIRIYALNGTSEKETDADNQAWFLSRVKHGGYGGNASPVLKTRSTIRNAGTISVML